jgi:hypothetical protein
MSRVDVMSELEVGIAVVMGRKRCLVVPLRWRGLAPHNVVAVFPGLSEASRAARRLAAVPSAVSAAVVVPVDRGTTMSVIVGVHTGQRDVADEAAVSLRRSGAKRVVRFPHRGDDSARMNEI